MASLFWITGLSGSGKTTLANLLVKKLEEKNQKTILIDGDVIRDIFENSNDYRLVARLKTAYEYSKLAAFLIKQNINVVCSTISLFHEVQSWNRDNISNYIEIFLDVTPEELFKRDIKRIYSRALNGELKDVVGIDIKAEFPRKPEVILKNPAKEELERIAAEIATFLR